MFGRDTQLKKYVPLIYFLQIYFKIQTITMYKLLFR